MLAFSVPFERVAHKYVISNGYHRIMAMHAMGYKRIPELTVCD